MTHLVILLADRGEPILSPAKIADTWHHEYWILLPIAAINENRNQLHLADLAIFAKYVAGFFEREEDQISTNFTSLSFCNDAW